MSKPLIYIAGPYTHPDPVQNTHHAIKVGEFVERTFDCGIVIPHLNLLWDMVKPAPVETWYARDLHILERCDAVYRMEGASKGADAECEHAATFAIPVFFDNWDDNTTMLLWRKKWSPVAAVVSYPSTEEPKP